MGHHPQHRCVQSGTGVGREVLSKWVPICGREMCALLGCRHCDWYDSGWGLTAGRRRVKFDQLHSRVRLPRYGHPLAYHRRRGTVKERERERVCRLRTSCWWMGFDGGPAGWNLITFARHVHQGMAFCWRVKMGDGSQEWCSRWMRFDGERDWVWFDRPHFVARTKVWSSVGASTSQRKEFYILDIFIYFNIL